MLCCSSGCAEKFGTILSQLKIGLCSSLSASCFEHNLTRYSIPPLLCWEMHRRILMGSFFFFSFVWGFLYFCDKNSSRKFLKGLSCYDVILIQACVYSESCRQLVIMSLAFILSISSLQNRNFRR